MILIVPDAATLHLALSSGVVPADVAAAPAVLSTDTAGRLFVETDAKLAKKTREDLDRLGIVGSRRHAGETRALVNWFQAVPTHADAPKFSAQAPVLFALPSSAGLPLLVAEMLRLGNDRQAYRHVTSASGDVRPLLRVTGPPYYSLLRAIDRMPLDSGEVVRAYAEAAPRVWVEVGHAHPFAARIQPPADQILLVHAPGAWEFLPDAPYRDVYELLSFPLPAQPTAWTPTEAAARVKVPLRLVPGNAADVPELWAVPGGNLADLDAFVRDADERLLAQLRFAVATSPTGEPCVLLRTTPTARRPPQLELPGAVGYKPFWKLPYLFLPVGTRLHPPIRREAVRNLLAPEPEEVVWLVPGGGGAFAPQVLPERAFRPLTDWVEYVLDTHREPVAAWVAATGFDFDSFTCTDVAPAAPKPPADAPRLKRPDREAAPGPTTPAEKKNADGTAAAAATAQYAEAPIVVRAPSAWKVRRDELEARFLAVDGPLDDPARVALWPALAEANAGIGEGAREEAAVAWLNALWTDSTPDRVTGWLNAESATGTFTAPELDKLLTRPNPTLAEVRWLAAGVLATAQPKPPAWLTARLPAVQAYLLQHERTLPVRAVWLLAVQFAKLGGADVLGLARARDRILQRLLDEGLSAERDLPGFLRFAGLTDSERIRAVRDRAGELHAAARAWTVASSKAGPNAKYDAKPTLAYLDLMFAFAFAKLGESTAAARLLAAAEKSLVVPKPPEPAEKQNVNPFTGFLTHGFLFRAFRYRVEQAMAGKPTGGPLAPDVVAELDALRGRAPATGATSATNPYSKAVYFVERMAEQSAVLEPHEKLDPYASRLAQSDPTYKALVDLPAIRDPAQFARRTRELYKNAASGKPTPETRFLVLHSVLPFVPRAGEEFAVEMVKLVPDALAAHAAVASAANDLATKHGQLLERGLFVAAHYDRVDLVQTLMDRFSEFLRTRPEEQRFDLVNVVAGQCLRSLRKLGLQSEIDKFLRRMQDDILQNRTPEQIRAQFAAKPDLWANALRTLLNLAAGWLSFGLADRALPILDAARTELFHPSAMTVQPFVRLAKTYATALGHGSAEVGLPRLVELFERLPAGSVTYSFTTADFYSRLHLNLVEAAVLALVSDDHGLGAAGRKWLDEDESIVRKRVHADMRRSLDATGL